MSPDERAPTSQTLDVEFVDLRYAELPNIWRHWTIPVRSGTLELLATGYTLPARTPASTDDPLKLLPDTDTAFLDPFMQHPTLAVICDVQGSATGTAPPLDPRAVARRLSQHLRHTTPSTELTISSEIEFFIFDEVSFGQSTQAGHYRIDSREGAWRQGAANADNLGTQIAGNHAGSPGPLPPADTLHNLRAEMAAALESMGVALAGHGRGPGTGGHGRILLAPAPLVAAADRLMLARYVIRNVAARHGKVATFMPQPLLDQPGSGLTVELTFAEGPAKSGDLARRLRALFSPLCALTNPTTNSYERLGVLSESADLIEPISFTTTCASGVRCTFPDCCANPYLALSAIVRAALADLADTTSQCGLPGSLSAAASALETDHDWLMRDHVFAPELVYACIASHRAAIAEIARRPHPHEFSLYFNA